MTTTHFPDDGSFAPAQTSTRISDYLKTRPLDEKPPSVAEFDERMMNLAVLAKKWTGTSPDNNFSNPKILSLDFVTGIAGNRKNGVTLVQEMLLLAMEAKPRPVSFAIQGYMFNDFISYIYQDIYYKERGINTKLAIENFDKYRRDIGAWLRGEIRQEYKRCNKWKIRKGIQLLFDKNHIVHAHLMFQGKSISRSILTLMYKLMESDEDDGYTNGSIRDFRLIRQDLNLLGNYCFVRRYGNDSKRMRTFREVIPPLSEDMFSKSQAQPVRQTNTLISVENEGFKMVRMPQKAGKSKVQQQAPQKSLLSELDDILAS